MTLRFALLVGMAVLGSTPAHAQTHPTGMNEPMVHVGLFARRADGRTSGSATQTGERAGADLAGTVYMAPCASMGGANPGHAISASATEVWQLSGKVLELTAEHASVQVGWQRIRRAGQEDASPPQFITLSLKRGERSTLETISIPAAGSCEARDASLDVTFATRSELYSLGQVNTTGGAGSSAGTARVFTQSRGGVTSVAVAGGGQAAPTLLNADLWLVRTVPGRPDETWHLTSPVVALPRPFAFAPVTIHTTTGTVTVTVAGSLEVGATPAGERRFHFSANRTVTFAPTSGAVRDGARIVEGSVKTTVAVPGPDEVLSFELPALRVPGGATVPDRLSIRVRLTSTSMQEVERPR